LPTSESLDLSPLSFFLLSMTAANSSSEISPCWCVCMCEYMYACILYDQWFVSGLFFWFQRQDPRARAWNAMYVRTYACMYVSVYVCMIFFPCIHHYCSSCNMYNVCVCVCVCVHDISPCISYHGSRRAKLLQLHLTSMQLLACVAVYVAFLYLYACRYVNSCMFCGIVCLLTDQYRKTYADAFHAAEYAKYE
jgi:hypothetical protein